MRCAWQFWHRGGLHTTLLAVCCKPPLTLDKSKTSSTSVRMAAAADSAPQQMTSPCNNIDWCVMGADVAWSFVQHRYAPTPWKSRCACWSRAVIAGASSSRPAVMP